jgi:hypothetical protein
VLDDTTASWWYEQDGQQAGPVTAAAIERLAAEGRLGPAHRVWRDGMAGWEPLAKVPELAAALRAARPAVPVPPPLSPPSPPGLGAPQEPPPSTGYGARPSPQDPAWSGFGAPVATTVPAAGALEEISPGVVLVLSIVTFGIYGLVKFHQTGKGYEALAGRPSTFNRDFWLAVGLGVASGLTVHTIVLGGPLSVASLVFSVLALSEALTLREEILRRTGIRPQLTEPGTHKVLFVLGCVLTPILVGLVLLIVQAWKWFSDWNAVGVALARSSAAAPSSGPRP